MRRMRAKGVEMRRRGVGGGGRKEFGWCAGRRERREGASEGSGGGLGGGNVGEVGGLQ